MSLNLAHPVCPVQCVQYKLVRDGQMAAATYGLPG